ncbi:FL cytokine receptor [Echinococcus multilocularis]|uniref:FL cytokine receptor n=1 Tax=Echinococcus multilocularis TaxID=6211 RepID=A0A068YA26_ECHMU|nr:FL cytokine receptor [Echinococcus multilocularis]
MTLVPEPRPCLRAYMNALYQQRELDRFIEVDGICEVDSTDVDVTAFVEEIEMMKFISKHENMIRLQATSIHNDLVEEVCHPLLLVCNQTSPNDRVNLLCFALEVANGMVYLVSKDGRALLEWMAPESIFQKVFTAKPDIRCLQLLGTLHPQQWQELDLTGGSSARVLLRLTFLIPFPNSISSIQPLLSTF